MTPQQIEEVKHSSNAANFARIAPIVRRGMEQHAKASEKYWEDLQALHLELVLRPENITNLPGIEEGKRKLRVASDLQKNVVRFHDDVTRKVDVEEATVVQDHAFLDRLHEATQPFTKVTKEYEKVEAQALIQMNDLLDFMRDRVGRHAVELRAGSLQFADQSDINRYRELALQLQELSGRSAELLAKMQRNRGAAEKYFEQFNK